MQFSENRKMQITQKPDSLSRQKCTVYPVSVNSIGREIKNRRFTKNVGVRYFRGLRKKCEELKNLIHYLAKNLQFKDSAILPYILSVPIQMDAK